MPYYVFQRELEDILVLSVLFLFFFLFSQHLFGYSFRTDQGIDVKFWEKLHLSVRQLLRKLCAHAHCVGFVAYVFGRNFYQFLVSMISITATRRKTGLSLLNGPTIVPVH